MPLGKQTQKCAMLSWHHFACSISDPLTSDHALKACHIVVFRDSLV
jgi:hypothetical protein